MSDYYISNRTFFLSGSKIYSSQGSGSSVNKSNGEEFTTEWWFNQDSISVLDALKITKEVSGSHYYVRDNMNITEFK
tara:strand:+ start:1010 stop:1240 length:231 start_codon:yes stop_codon:yes gene_type:complete